MDIGTLDFDLVNPRLKVGDFESVLFVFNSSFGNTRPYSYIGYDNPRIFKLHESGKAALDPDEQNAIFRQIMAIHSED